MKAELVPENGDPPIPIVKDVTVVGRREFCDVMIDDPSLSKRHCVLVKTDGLLVIRDLATTNGTKVKGQRIRWAALLPDDRIALGAYKMRVYLGPDNVPGPSEMPRRADARAKAAPASAPPVPLAGPGDSLAPLPGNDEFRPPSPIEAPALAGEFWEAAEDDDEDPDDVRWQDLVVRRAPEDDVIIDLD